MQNTNLINDHQAAKTLGLAVQTLRNWRCNGIGPRYIKLGRAIRYAPEHLVEFAQAHEITPVKEA